MAASGLEDEAQTSSRQPQTEKRAPTALDLEAIVDEVHPVDPDVARRVLRKIDLFLMPAMVIGMF